MKMLSVFDHKVGAFFQPFFARTVAEAERMFADSCADPEHLFCKHPEDFTLFVIGEFHQDSGVMECVSTPEPVAKALKYQRGQLFPFFDRGGDREVG